MKITFEYPSTIYIEERDSVTAIVFDEDNLVADYESLCSVKPSREWLKQKAEEEDKHGLH